MTSSWRKVEDKDGFLYYLNDVTNSKQWDHPKFGDIRQRLDDCNYVKYSMYRVALKFRVLQNALYMEEVPLSIVAGVFERHRLGVNESSLCFESCDLEAVLSDIYFAANKKNHINIDIDFATELMLNFIYNIYDKDRQGKIQVASTKITLSLLSNCTLKELYRFIFGLCADHNNLITRLRLQSLLMKIVEITTFLHEDSSYGPHLVNAAIENCFLDSPGLVGIDENAFMTWVGSSPKILSWLPLLHRIKMAESVIHSIKCTTCKTKPVMGLRYKCVKCTRYTQCQRCFFTGRTSHSHKLSHSMREYCTQNNGENYTFIKKICSLLQCSPQDSSTVIETKPLCDQKIIGKTQSREILCNIKPLSSPQTQLQVIIRQLELQNKELQQILMLGSRNEKEMITYLEEHRMHVAAQIQKLKILKEYLKIPCSPKFQTTSSGKEIVESTPMIDDGCRNDRNVDFDLFSPIRSLPGEPSESDVWKTAPNRRASVKSFNQDASSVPYCIDDISTWIGGHPTASTNSSKAKPTSIRKSPVRELHSDLDDALAKLQQILANNFSMDESLGHVDNTNLKFAVSEVEGVLTSIIDSVESSRGGSVRSHKRVDQNSVTN